MLTNICILYADEKDAASQLTTIIIIFGLIFLYWLRHYIKTIRESEQTDDMDEETEDVGASTQVVQQHNDKNVVKVPTCSNSLQPVNGVYNELNNVDQECLELTQLFRRPNYNMNEWMSDDEDCDDIMRPELDQEQEGNRRIYVSSDDDDDDDCTFELLPKRACTNICIVPASG